MVEKLENSLKVNLINLFQRRVDFRLILLPTLNELI